MNASESRSRVRRSRAGAGRRIAGAVVAAGLALAGAAAPATATAASQSPQGASTARVGNGDFLIRLDEDLYLLGPTGKNLRRLTRIGDSQIAGRFSPDGSKIVFSTSGGLYVMNADGTRMRALPLPVAASDPSFSRDGSKVAFRFYGGYLNSGIAFTDARPGAPMTVTIQDGPHEGYCEGGATWPDGEYSEAIWSPIADNMAVLQDCFADPMSDHLVRIIGPLGKRIAAFGARSSKSRLDFSPDGRRIVYGTEDRDWYKSIEVIDRKTGSTTPLNHPEAGDEGAWPAFSPDGARIAAILRSRGSYIGLNTMRASDGGDRRVVRFVPGEYFDLLDWRAAR